MSTAWDSHETRDLVMTLYGKQQWFALAQPTVRSFKDRIEFVAFHYHELKGMLTRYIDEKLAGVDTMMWLHADADEFDDFSEMMRDIRAHATGAIQSLHAMGDTCAHMLLFALALDREPNAPKPRDVNASSVLRAMKGAPDLDQLTLLFKALVSGAGWKRVAGEEAVAQPRTFV